MDFVCTCVVDVTIRQAIWAITYFNMGATSCVKLNTRTYHIDPTVNSATSTKGSRRILITSRSVACNYHIGPLFVDSSHTFL